MKDDAADVDADVLFIAQSKDRKWVKLNVGGGLFGDLPGGVNQFIPGFGKSLQETLSWFGKLIILGEVRTWILPICILPAPSFQTC